MREATNMYTNSNRRPATTPRPTTNTQPDRPSKTEQIHTALFSHYQR